MRDLKEFAHHCVAVKATESDATGRVVAAQPSRYFRSQAAAVPLQYARGAAVNPSRGRIVVSGALRLLQIDVMFGHALAIDIQSSKPPKAHTQKKHSTPTQANNAARAAKGIRSSVYSRIVCILLHAEVSQAI